MRSGSGGASDTPRGVSAGTVQLSPAFLHQFTIGLAYAFNHPSPPPPASIPVAAPAPEPARNYLVFFDWDRAELTARARQVVAEAAGASARVQKTQIVVNGYTDLSGPTSYNLGLSLRRARAIGAELMRDGVSSARRSRCTVLARAAPWCRPPRAYASRRTAGWRSSCSSEPLGAMPADAPSSAAWQDVKTSCNLSLI